MVELIESYLVRHLWSGLLLWAALSVAEYTLILISVRASQRSTATLSQQDFQLELNPYYRRDALAMKPFSPRYAGLVVAIALGLAGIWYFGTVLRDYDNIYAFVLGGVSLQSSVALIRRARLSAVLHFLSGEDESVALHYPEWVARRSSGVELFGYALLLLGLFLITGSWFILGGFVFVLNAARTHWSWSSATGSRPPAGESER
jgi:hypothetical protein